jgi:hypothetical protein
MQRVREGNVERTKRVALSVIGAGFGRTGTKSLKEALELLGFGPCHHMVEVAHNRDQLPYWQAAAAGQTVDWAAVFANYRSAVDWPACHFWRELGGVWPEAKIILSVRPEDKWWESFTNTIKITMDVREHLPDPYRKGVSDMAHALISDLTFHAPLHDRQAGLAAYRQRIAEVQAEVPAERLLTFDVAEGWAPLCRFLDVPVPAAAFPHSNSTKDFWIVDRARR